MITELVVHARDERTGRGAPAYSVFVTDGGVFAFPYEKRWLGVARSVERALNDRYEQALDRHVAEALIGVDLRPEEVLAPVLAAAAELPY